MSTNFGLLGAHISAEPISAPDIATAETGAVVLFDGIVRNHDSGRGVKLLTYTAHTSAQQEIERVAGEVAAASRRKSPSGKSSCTPMTPPPG